MFTRSLCLFTHMKIWILIDDWVDFHVHSAQETVRNSILNVRVRNVCVKTFRVYLFAWMFLLCLINGKLWYSQYNWQRWLREGVFSTKQTRSQVSWKLFHVFCVLYYYKNSCLVTTCNTSEWTILFNNSRQYALKKIILNTKSNTKESVLKEARYT